MGNKGAWASKLDLLGSNSSSVTIIGYVTLGKSLSLSVSGFHIWNGDSNITYIIGLLLNVADI